jgi:shikimate 5-dehydrogenase
MVRIVMIGFPLTHVRSPAIINAMLHAEGVDAEVVTQKVREHELDAFVGVSRGGPDIAGLIVTTPLKQAIHRYLDQRTELVDLTGASNCIRYEGPVWIGANFDGYGFAAALGPMRGRRVLVLGCGGAGSAIAASLAKSGSIELFLYDREPLRAIALASRLEGPATSVAQPIAADVIINASTAGMAEGDASPVPDEIAAGAAVIADIIVGRDTALKRQARHHGKRLIEGEAMVDGQARLLKRFILGTAMSEPEVLAELARDEVSERIDAGAR